MSVGRTLLTTVPDRFEARVLQARLAAEGLDVQLRGPVDDPYVFTVGDHARVEVWVASGQVDLASYVLLADEIDAALVDACRAPRGTWRAFEPGMVTRRWTAAALCGLLAVAPVARLLAAVA